LRNIYIIISRELKTFFTTPVSHVISAFFLFFMGLIFSLLIFYDKTADLRGLISVAVVTFLLIVPVVTMRLFSEEKKTGTIELLLTNPISDWEVVLGKYFSSVVFFLFLMVMTFEFPLVLMIYSEPDIGVTFSGYLGFFLIGCFMIAVGTLASSLCRSQIISAISSFSTLLVLWFIDETGEIFPKSFSEFIEYISIYNHFDGFLMGQISSSSLIFYISMIFLVLFLTTRVIESRKWR